MAQPWAAAEGTSANSSAHQASSGISAKRTVVREVMLISICKGRPLASTYLMWSQVHQPDAIREEHDQHHANAEYHSRNQEQKQPQAFEAQVHEVGHDQSRLDER